jgi:hypothetical protein
MLQRSWIASPERIEVRSTKEGVTGVAENASNCELKSCKFWDDDPK